MTAVFRFLFIGVTIMVLALLVLLVPLYQDPGPKQVLELPQAKAAVVKPSPEQQALEDRLGELGEAFDGQVGIAVFDLQNDRAMQYHGEEYYPQQSVSKLWVTLTALDLVDRGKLDLSEPVEIRFQDLTLFHQPIREIVRARGSFRTDYADLIERAITRSDNTANDTILRRVGGPKAVEHFIRRNALTGVRFGLDERTKQSAIAGLTWRQDFAVGRRFYEARDAVPPQERVAAYEGYLADPVDGATPLGLVGALAKLAKGELLSPGATATMLATLQRTHSGPRRLKGGVPLDWTIGHKTGTGQALEHEQTGYNDIGILTSPEGRQYTVAVMIRRTETGIPTRMELMQQVVRETVAYDRAINEASSPASERPSAPEAAAE